LWWIFTLGFGICCSDGAVNGKQSKESNDVEDLSARMKKTTLGETQA